MTVLGITASPAQEVFPVTSTVVIPSAVVVVTVNEPVTSASVVQLIDSVVAQAGGTARAAATIDSETAKLSFLGNLVLTAACRGFFLKRGF